MRWFAFSMLVIAACGARTGLRGSGGVNASDGGGGDASGDAPTVLPTCASSIIEISTTAPRPDQVALDADFVYWHDVDGVSRAPKSGGPAQQLATHGPMTWPALAGFALSSTDVYFDADDTGQVAWVSKQGGPASPIPMPLQFPRVATDATTLYMWSSAGGANPLFAGPLGGAPGVPVATLPTSTSKIAIDGGRAFTATNGGVQAIDLGTGTVTYLSGLGASDVAFDATDVYFTTIDVTNGTRVMRVPKAGGFAADVVDQVGSYTLAVTATDLYFADRVDLSVHKAIGKDGSNVAIVASVGPDRQPLGIATDDHCVYIAAAHRNQAGAGGIIFAAPK